MGGKNKSKAKERLDKYYDLAKQQGYRARSAFKLIQLNRKYSFLNKATTLVDLCAAPGGWMQVAAKNMPVTSTIVGVDLVRIRPIAGCKCLTGDIYADRTRKDILQGLKGKKADVVLHDGSPNVGGVWAREAFAQHQLVLQACKLACQVLVPGGWFITKVFRAEEFNTIMWVMRQLFEKVEATKPLASRMESAEVFIVCAGFKAPKKLDPKFFKASEVFADVGDSEPIMQADGSYRKQVTKVPQGYDKMGPQFSSASITDFLKSPDPRGFIGYFSEIKFDATNVDDEAYRQSTHSTKEMMHLCTDLRQVSDADKKRMLKWRDRLLVIRAMRHHKQGASDADNEGPTTHEEADAASDKESNGSMDEADITQQLTDIQRQKIKDKKKKDDKLVSRKLRHLGRILHFDPNDVQHTAEEEELADGIQGDLTADDFDTNWDVGYDQRPEALLPMEHENMNPNDDDDDDMEFEESENEEEDGLDDDPDVQKAKRIRKNFYSNMESVLDQTFPKQNKLHDNDLHARKKRKAGKKGEDEIVTLRCDGNLRDEDDEVPMLDSDNESDDTQHQGAAPKSVAEATLQALTKAQRKGAKAQKSGGKEGGFEEIPVEMSNPETRARTLAIATKMLDKKARREIMEGAIHKFATQDDDLPDWFAKEEQRHYFRPIPVTKEEIDYQRDRFKEINLRPSKKVAEAVGRKRRKASKLLRRVQVKGNTDPKAKEKGDRLSVRKLMRSKSLNPIHSTSMDNRMKGERARTRQKEKKRKR